MSLDPAFFLAILIFPIMALLGVSALVALVIYKRKKPLKHKANIKQFLGIFSKVSACILLAAVIGYLLFNVVPEEIRNKNWLAKQERCAQHAGFKNAVDANSGDNLTSIENISYQQCINK